MNLAVKLYKDEPTAPVGMPGDYPCECIQETDDRFQAALDSGIYQLMTLQAFTQYKSDRAAEYATWYDATFPPPAQVVP